MGCRKCLLNMLDLAALLNQCAERIEVDGLVKNQGRGRLHKLLCTLGKGASCNKDEGGKQVWARCSYMFKEVESGHIGHHQVA